MRVGTYKLQVTYPRYTYSLIAIKIIHVLSSFLDYWNVSNLQCFFCIDYANNSMQLMLVNGDHWCSAYRWHQNKIMRTNLTCTSYIYMPMIRHHLRCLLSLWWQAIRWQRSYQPEVAIAHSWCVWCDSQTGASLWTKNRLFDIHAHSQVCTWPLMSRYTMVGSFIFRRANTKLLNLFPLHGIIELYFVFRQLKHTSRFKKHKGKEWT
jgi:hypothetical protein